MIFVANDSGAWGEDGFNPWFDRKLCTKTGVKITLAVKLSDIKTLTRKEYDGIRDIERRELKDTAVQDFINSNSFISAGENIRKLKEYEDILKYENYISIIDASISNNQIYQSVFTSSGLNYICEGEKEGYVKKCLEGIDSIKWSAFSKFCDISLVRLTDERDKK